VELEQETLMPLLCQITRILMLIVGRQLALSLGTRVEEDDLCVAAPSGRAAVRANAKLTPQLIRKQSACYSLMAPPLIAWMA